MSEIELHFLIPPILFPCIYKFYRFHNSLVPFQTSKVESQVSKTVHFQQLLLFAYSQGVAAAKATREACDVHGESGIA